MSLSRARCCFIFTFNPVMDNVARGHSGRRCSQQLAGWRNHKLKSTDTNHNENMSALTNRTGRLPERALFSMNSRTQLLPVALCRGNKSQQLQSLPRKTREEYFHKSTECDGSRICLIKPVTHLFIGAPFPASPHRFDPFQPVRGCAER